MDAVQGISGDGRPILPGDICEVESIWPPIWLDDQGEYSNGICRCIGDENILIYGQVAPGIIQGCRDGVLGTQVYGGERFDGRDEGWGNLGRCIGCRCVSRRQGGCRRIWR